jgi:hypothetical protein
MLGDAGALKKTLEQSGIKQDTLSDADKRISFQKYVKLWRHGIENTADPLLGLRAGAAFHPGNLGALASVLVAAPNFVSAVEQLIRYEHLLQDGMQTLLYEAQGRAHAEFTCATRESDEISPLIEKELSEALALAKFFFTRGRFRKRPSRSAFQAQSRRQHRRI